MIEVYKRKFFEKEKFSEMSRIGNLLKHKQISVWVNEKGEDREDPHFHVRLFDNIVYRLGMINLSDIDLQKKKLSKEIIKEIKNFLIRQHKGSIEAGQKITNLQFAILTWNAQIGHKQKINLHKMEWIIIDKEGVIYVL